MATTRLAFERGGAPRVELTYPFTFSSVEVSFDGTRIASFEARDLKSEQSVPLTDGTSIELALVSGLGGKGWAVSRNGVPLPGSARDPETIALKGVNAVSTVAILSAIGGVAALALQQKTAQKFGLSPYSLGGAVIFGALYVFAKKMNPVAMGTAIGLYALDMAFWMVGIFSVRGPQAGPPPVAPFVVKVFLLIFMAQGLRAMLQVAPASEGSAQPTRPPAPGAAMGAPMPAVAAAVPVAGTTDWVVCGGCQLKHRRRPDAACPRCHAAV